MFLLVKLNSYRLSVIYIGETVELISISGYSLDEWILDVSAKLNIVGKKFEISKLHEMELKLDEMLSQDKKTELELGRMAQTLNL